MSQATTRHRFVVGSEEAGLRLDQALAARVPELSRRKARALIDIGGVFVDRARVKVAGRTLRPGQEIVAVVGAAFERATKEVGKAARKRDAEGLPTFRLVYRDDDLVVVDKPAGLLTAPTPEGDQHTLVRLVAGAVGGPIFVVHRLDLGTSGLLVLARTEAANRALAEVFRTHDVERVYVAALSGRPAWEQTTVTAPIATKTAKTHFHVVERIGSAITLVKCLLYTGRTHQIRLHARHVGHPVLGDAEHGDLAADAKTKPPRMALHAAVLGFVHPISKEKLLFESGWPPALAEWLERVRCSASGEPQ